jgi:homoserine kinase
LTKDAPAQACNRDDFMKPVIVKVPASTSNLGSGFDTLGLAVNLHTVLEVSTSASPAVNLCSEVPASSREGLTDLLDQTAELFFLETGRKRFGIDLKLSGNVPVARGLGYSATLRVGTLAALNCLAGEILSRGQLLQLATQLEHHPDNASPSILGGFTVSGTVNGEIRCLRFDVPEELRLVTLIPQFPVSTEAARKLMPAQYSKPETAHGLNRAALITAAFASGNLEALRGLFDDRIHQPYREPLIPVLRKVINEGEQAGALGGFLSGSGSAIICLTLQNPEAVGQAMQRALPDSQLLILRAENNGYTIS